jgi:aryl-alcohol dehydrogenase-like predicted oxidoreductase
MTFGDRDKDRPVGSTTLEESRAIVDRAIEAGVNLVDSADAYVLGRSEEFLGEILRGRRDSVLIATKARFPMGAGPNDEGLSRHHLIEACEASLRRLRTDHVDIYFVHEWDGLTPIEETLSALDDLVHDGKVRYIGCSNYAGWQLMKALGTSDRLHLQRFVCQQIYYSLIGRDSESELVPLSIDQGLGVLVWSPLAGGLLTGKYRRGHDGPLGTRHATLNVAEPPISNWDHVYDVIDAVVKVAEGHGVSGAQVAIAWLLGRPAVSGVVVGARSVEQLTDNLGAADLVLTDDERAYLDRVSRPELRYPYWHQTKAAAGRLGPADLALLAQYLPA